MVNFDKNTHNAYRGIVIAIEEIFKTKLKQFNNVEDNEINERVVGFYNLLDDNKLFSLFAGLKIKSFSSKDDQSASLSMSLFGDTLLLKNAFNNQSETNKLLLWDSLLNLYLNLELLNNNREDRVSALNARLHNIKSKLSDHVKKQLLPEDVNDTTSNMVNDIIGSFQNLMSENKNPFNSIMDITTSISEKYYKNIENGDIEVDKILKNMPFAGNSGSDNPEEMMGDMMKNMGGAMGDMMGGSMGDMMGGMFNKMTGKEEVKDPTVIDDEFSTADVNVGKDELENKGKGLIGNVMDMANGMGGDMPGLGDLPNLGDLGNMMGDLTNLTNGNIEENDNEKLNDIKNKMDSFMENSLGIDMNDFNKNMENLVKKMENDENKDNLNVNRLD